MEEERKKEEKEGRKINNNKIIIMKYKWIDDDEEENGNQYEVCFSSKFNVVRWIVIVFFTRILKSKGTDGCSIWILK